MVHIISKFLIFIIIATSSSNLCFATENKTDATTVVKQHALKIGVINLKELENCLYAKEIRRKLEKEFNPRNDKFTAKQKELQNKGDLLERDRAVLSEKERISRDRELTKLQQEVQHMAESLDVEFKSRLQEELINFNKVVDDVVTKLAETEKYDLILLDQVVKFSKESLDCTAKIVSKLDANFKAKK